MPATDASRILVYSVRQVLETMCFSEAFPASETFKDEDVVGATIGFGGSVSGTLRLEIGRNTAEYLAASLLGLSNTASYSSLAEDTVSELGNMICGRFLSLLAPSAMLSIDSPVKSEKRDSGCAAPWHTFRADSGLFRIAFLFNSHQANWSR